MRNNGFFRGLLRDADPGAAGGGAGAGGDGGFDAARFRTEVMAEVNKTLNGGLSRLERQLASLKPPDQPKGDPPPDPDPDMKSGKDDPKIKALEQKLAKLNEALANTEKARQETEKAALEKERLSMIRTELSKHGLAEHAQDDAFRFFRDEVKRNESGELMGPDEVPFSDFVKSTVEKRAHWLPPRPTNGTGASGGTQRAGAGGVDIDAIKPGASKEILDAARAEIARALTNR